MTTAPRDVPTAIVYTCKSNEAASVAAVDGLAQAAKTRKLTVRASLASTTARSTLLDARRPLVLPDGRVLTRGLRLPADPPTHRRSPCGHALGRSAGQCSYRPLTEGLS
ncbi:hypothetical protein ACIQNG_34120 [Streptomyces sp. NPDC091377]|uniref:hypothetical protein n=1 Tax=Streptomyces sp. NPDC091377 TaxID=3365995 RepID=UPI0037FD0002